MGIYLFYVTCGEQSLKGHTGLGKSNPYMRMTKPQDFAQVYAQGRQLTQDLIYKNIAYQFP